MTKQLRTISAERKLDYYRFGIGITRKNNAPQGVYTVRLLIQLDKKGKVINVQADNDPGYGSLEEALRVAYLSPKWTPAIQYNHPVAYKARQTISFNVVY